MFLFVLIMTESIKWQYFEQMCIQDVLLRVGRWKKKKSGNEFIADAAPHVMLSNNTTPGVDV